MQKQTNKMAIHIVGTGSCIPNLKKENEAFLDRHFLTPAGEPFEIPNEEIIEKFKAITGIYERRYAEHNQVTSDLAAVAGQKAIEASKINPESLDYIIVAHNFGDLAKDNNQPDALPSLATRVKHKLGIENPNCVAYDLIFGCPGWVEGVIQAQAFIRAGMAKTCLVIGADTLSRISDPNDRDSMIYADGAGACIIQEIAEMGGILSHKTVTYAQEEAGFLFFGQGNNTSENNTKKYIKMHGHKIYEFALNRVPQALQACLEASGKTIENVKKILIHQANEKMDEAIVKRFFRLYKLQPYKGVLPMSINTLGNSSVATVPTLLDLIVRNQLKGHNLQKGDVVLLASVGAGMNINAITYQF